MEGVLSPTPGRQDEGGRGLGPSSKEIDEKGELGSSPGSHGLLRQDGADGHILDSGFIPCFPIFPIMEPNGSLSTSSLISTLTALFQFWSPPQSFSLKPFLLCPHLAQWLLQHKPTALSLLHRGHWATGCCSSYSSHHTVPPPGDPHHPPPGKETAVAGTKTAQDGKMRNSVRMFDSKSPPYKPPRQDSGHTSTSRRVWSSAQLCPVWTV